MQQAPHGTMPAAWLPRDEELSYFTHQPLGSVLKKTGCDLLALQLLPVTQWKLQVFLFHQWLHIMALGQAKNQTPIVVVRNRVKMSKRTVKTGRIVAANYRDDLTSVQFVSTRYKNILFNILFFTYCYASLRDIFSTGYCKSSAPQMFTEW